MQIFGSREAVVADQQASQIGEVPVAGSLTRQQSIDVIAIDATARPRPERQELEDLIQRARVELRAPLMADVDSVENGLRAASLGCDWVGTTLFGYTEETTGQQPPGLSLLPDLRHQLKTSVRLICEGGIASPETARSALKAGADNVVVGTAITGVDLQVAAYCRGMAG